MGYYSGSLYQRETRLWRYNLKRAQIGLEAALTDVAKTHEAFAALRDRVFDRQVEALSIIEKDHIKLDAKMHPQAAPIAILPATATSVGFHQYSYPHFLSSVAKHAIPHVALTLSTPPGTPLPSPICPSFPCAGDEEQFTMQAAGAHHQTASHLCNGCRHRRGWPSCTRDGLEGT